MYITRFNKLFYIIERLFKKSVNLSGKLKISNSQFKTLKTLNNVRKKQKANLIYLKQ